MNQNFYIAVSDQQQGPFTIDELRTKGIQRDTLVWTEGLENWTKAEYLPFFKDILKSVPPPLPKSDLKTSAFQAPPPIPPTQTVNAQKERQTPPPFSSPPIYEASGSTTAHNTQHATSMPTKGNGINRVIKSLFFLTLIVVGVFVPMKMAFRGGDSSGAGSTSTSTYQEKKLSVLEVERANPAQFLSAEGTYNRTLFGKKIKIHGTVTNKATVANFKNITIEMIYYSYTNSEINRERFVLYDYVPAHSTKSFEWKINPPGGTNTIDWNALNAVPY